MASEGSINTGLSSGTKPVTRAVESCPSLVRGGVVANADGSDSRGVNAPSGGREKLGTSAGFIVDDAARSAAVGALGGAGSGWPAVAARDKRHRRNDHSHQRYYLHPHTPLPDVIPATSV